jgi:hypothetical protein
VGEGIVAAPGSLKLTFFWYGPTWDRFAKDTTLLKTLDPLKGDETLSLIIAHEVILYYPNAKRARVVTAEGLKTLGMLGVAEASEIARTRSVSTDR